ncbi:unnamed protein product [Polarella glacialis]|uniref:Acyltransferase n=1 Tax=Polarella glacialis TaxID=89957 RepID=A0A813DGN6_POLGL|nr:unnamed protein product [Polarella glacialis]
MVDCLEGWVRSHVAKGRRVVLLGESFGGLLSLAVALRLGKEELKGLVLVNPATSFGRTVWPLLGKALVATPAAALPPPGAQSNLLDFFQDLQTRAIESPYDYVGSLALTAAVADGSQLSRVASKIATRLLEADATGEASAGVDPLLQGFLMYPESLAKLLPPETVRFRLRGWLRDGCESVKGELRRKRGQGFGGGSLPPTLLLASESDRLLDSAKEAELLRPSLTARCGDNLLKVSAFCVPRLKGAGHAPLDERVNLAELIHFPLFDGLAPTAPAVFWWRSRFLFSRGQNPPLAETTLAVAHDQRDYTPPTLKFLEEGSSTMEPLAAVVSPVFCSRDPETGSRRFGLGGVPDPSELGRPVLLVGNHQLLALDLGPLVREFFIEKGFSPRGLAHPVNFPELMSDMMSAGKEPEQDDSAGAVSKVVFKSTDAPHLPGAGLLDFMGLPYELRAAGRASLEAASSLLGGGRSYASSFPPGRSARPAAADTGQGQELAENFGLGGGFAKWGAVPVTPRNFFRLLQRKEAVLLFPGGAREACHGAGEKYQLFWPTKTDFVRIAARFDAIIVPFGSVGSADNVVAGDNKYDATSASETSMQDNLEGGGFLPVSEALREPPRFPNVSPRLPTARQAAPGLGDRFYFSFGTPVDLKGLDPKDKDGCDKVYKSLQGDVEAEISWLLEARVRDPYRDFVRRQMWERVANLSPVPRKARHVCVCVCVCVCVRASCVSVCVLGHDKLGSGLRLQRTSVKFHCECTGAFEAGLRCTANIAFVATYHSHGIYHRSQTATNSLSTNRRTRTHPHMFTTIFAHPLHSTFFTTFSTPSFCSFLSRLLPVLGYLSLALSSSLWPRIVVVDARCAVCFLHVLMIFVVQTARRSRWSDPFLERVPAQLQC